jgi:hypothetical protein
MRSGTCLLRLGLGAGDLVLGRCLVLRLTTASPFSMSLRRSSALGPAPARPAEAAWRTPGRRRRASCPCCGRLKQIAVAPRGSSRSFSNRLTSSTGLSGRGAGAVRPAHSSALTVPGSAQKPVRRAALELGGRSCRARNQRGEGLHFRNGPIGLERRHRLLAFVWALPRGTQVSTSAADGHRT